MINKLMIITISLLSSNLIAGGGFGGTVPELVSVPASDYMAMMNAIKGDGLAVSNKPLIVVDGNGQAITFYLMKNLINHATFNFSVDNSIKTTKIVMDEVPNYTFTDILDEGDRVVVTVEAVVK